MCHAIHVDAAVARLAEAAHCPCLRCCHLAGATRRGSADKESPSALQCVRIRWGEIQGERIRNSPPRALVKLRPFLERCAALSRRPPASSHSHKMSKWKKGGKRAEDDFLDDEEKPAKKAKAPRAPAPSTDVVSVELGGSRRVSVGSWKGKPNVNIREFYQKDGEGPWLPGKKGIALSPAEWKTLLAHAPEVEAAIASLGGGAAGGEAAGAAGGEEAEEAEEGS